MIKFFCLMIFCLYFVSCAYNSRAECIKGDCFNGPGIVTQNSSKYNGEFKNGMMHGQGTLIHHNGDKFVGEWKNNQMNGPGFAYTSDGSVYEGNFKDNELHGKGIYTYPEGGTFKGVFKNNKMQRGMLTLPNGDLSYVGEFSGHQFHGYGIYYYKDKNGEEYVLSGKFVEGEFISNMEPSEVLTYLENIQSKNVDVKLDTDKSKKEITNQELDKYIAVMTLNPIGLSQQEAEILSERLTSRLVSLKKYTVIERANVNKIMEEQKFQSSGCTTQCAIEIGQLLNSNFIVIGTVSKFGKTYSIDCRVINVETSEIIKSATYSHIGDIDNLLNEGINSISNQLY